MLTIQKRIPNFNPACSVRIVGIHLHFPSGLGTDQITLLLVFVCAHACVCPHACVCAYVRACVLDRVCDQWSEGMSQAEQTLVLF